MFCVKISLHLGSNHSPAYTVDTSSVYLETRSVCSLRSTWIRWNYSSRLKSRGVIRDRNTQMDSFLICMPAVRLAPRFHRTFSVPPTDLRWTPNTPPTAGSKPSWMPRDRRRMMLSSTLNRSMIVLTHIMVFPEDRPGMSLFVLFLLFSVSLECQITQYARGNIGLGHHQSVYLLGLHGSLWWFAECRLEMDQTIVLW